MSAKKTTKKKAARKRVTKKAATKRGRKTAYRKEYARQAAKLCELGAIDQDLAEFFGVCRKTIDNWKQEHPEFLHTIKKAKEVADSNVERALYQRATGYAHPEEKVFISGGEVVTHQTVRHYPPDTPAGIFWLKNRRKDEWRDKIDHDVEFTGDIHIKLGGNVDDE